MTHKRSDNAKNPPLFADALAEMRGGRKSQARDICQHLLKADPAHANALHLLGVIERESGRPERAVELIRSSIARKPGVAAAHHNLGSAFQDLRQWKNAERAYRAALARNPRHARAYFGLGCVLAEQAHYLEAVEALTSAVTLEPGLAEAHHNLSLCLDRLGRTADAVHYARRATEVNSNDHRFHIQLGALSVDQCDIDAGRAAYSKALRLRPASLAALWGRLHALPRVYNSMDELDEARTRYASDLDAFTGALKLDSPAAVAEASRLLQTGTNFFLHYQGRNDLELQTRYAAVSMRIAHAAMPEFAEPRCRPSHDGRVRVRIGFVSSFFRHHSVTKTHGHFITRLNPSRFETYVYSLWPKSDATTERIRTAAAHFRHLPGPVREVGARIAADQLDVLVYPDIGMDPKVQCLSPLHLAPVQINGLAHPITSGLPSIGFCISSSLMEPENADHHYVEQLWRLPNLGMSYPCPRQAKADLPRTVDTSPRHGPIYLCSQSLFKLLPHFDLALARIAAEIGSCRIWLISAVGEAIERRIRERLSRSFRMLGLDPDTIVRWFPLLTHTQFQALNRAAHVSLDPFYWSGNNSTLEALAAGLPIVTLPGEMMRARHTLGSLRRIGLTPTIAESFDDYVRIAVRLGRDRPWREEMAAQVRNALRSTDRQLFDDATPINAFEDLVESATTSASR